MRKQLFAALILALIIITSAGCGGGSDEPEPAATTTTPASTTATASTTGTVPVASTSQTEKPKVPRELEYTKGSLPAAFEKAVYDSSVTVVLFYDPEETISRKVADMVDEVIESPDYSNQIEYLGYEVSGKTTASVAKLTTVLGAKYLPHLVIIDGDKNIVFEDSGFTETNYFEHALYNAVYKDNK